MDTINNMTFLDFIGDDIWTTNNRVGGPRRPHYEVRLTLSAKPHKKGSRVTITLKGKAYELTKEYKRARVSSFNRIGNDRIILIKVTKDEKAYGTYALSRSDRVPETTTIQFTPPQDEVPRYELWTKKDYTLSKMGEDLFCIQRSDKEA